MVDHVLLPFDFVIRSHGDRIVVLGCITFSDIDVVGVGAVVCHATRHSDGIEGSQIVAAVTTWLGVSAGRRVSKGCCCQWNVLIFYTD